LAQALKADFFQLSATQLLEKPPEAGGSVPGNQSSQPNPHTSLSKLCEASSGIRTNIWSSRGLAILAQVIFRAAEPAARSRCPWFD